MTIAPTLLADLARAREVPPSVALADLVDDALAAEGARANGFGERPAVDWVSTSTLARTVPLHLVEEARASGPPTVAERSLVLVVHAVVMRAPNLREETAVAIANAIRNAVRGVRDADEFKARANAVAHVGIAVVAEAVGPFGPDGRGPDGSDIDPGFVAAAFALGRPLETGPIIATPFGWHVMALVERRPIAEPGASAPELVDVVMALRARIRLQEVLRGQRQREAVEVSPAADDLMAREAASP